MPPLKNIRHELFCLAIFQGMSQKDAAIKAGYSISRARFTGSNLATNRNILARILELHEEIKSDAIMPPKERMERLSEIGRGRLTDFVKDGEPELDANTPNSGAAAEFYKRQRYDKEGNEVITKAIKLHNPISAIGELNKMDHIYDERVPVGTTIVNTFTFILPDGTRVSPRQLKEVNAIEVGIHNNNSASQPDTAI